MVTAKTLFYTLLARKCSSGRSLQRAGGKISKSFKKMAKHHPDLIMCRKQPGIAIGRLCEKCDGKCVICDSYVRYSPFPPSHMHTRTELRRLYNGPESCGNTCGSDGAGVWTTHFLAVCYVCSRSPGGLFDICT